MAAAQSLEASASLQDRINDHHQRISVLTDRVASLESSITMINDQLIDIRAFIGMPQPGDPIEGSAASIRTSVPL
jgi:phage shock protein A